MSAEMWNGFFVGAGILALVVALSVSSIAVIVALRMWRHVVQLYRRLATIDFGQDEGGAHKVLFSTRERFKEGVSVGIDPNTVGDNASIADLLSRVEGASTPRRSGSGPKEGGGEQ